MSILQYPDSFNVPELQVWNNAAFDNGESEDANAVKVSWCNLDSGSMNQSLESDGSKENQSPLWLKSPVYFKSTAPLVEPCSKNVPGNTKEPFWAKVMSGVGKEEDKKRDEKKIDMEIEETEKEVTRLSSKLEALRLEKAEYNARSIAMRGRIVPAKFMEPKQSIKNLETVKMIQDTPFSSAKPKLNRRGVSLGPAEIFSATKSRQFMKQELTTPIQSIQSRRKSCFFKLQDIDEGKVTRERGKSLSLSPKPRKTVSKVIAPKPAATTVGAKRAVKKEEGVLSTIQPKRLFKDGEKPVTAKKPLKPGRAVSSRYNQIPNQRNASLTMSDARKQDSNKHDKRRVSNEQIVDSCKNEKSENRVKKKWEIPSEVIILKEESPQSIDKINDLLPKIRTVRVWHESPRDSGPAKRVAELMGRKSYFNMEDSVRQALSFAEGDGEEE
ncbi:Tetratricopeptide repeat-like superfamily protein, putative isoform 1 [Hibiscus syriacus]|uniref:Tetratricopeptide repeat-like superfamily protein, putative isoform 1 n=1 Tax=Hibiscus syriacus TaxID=106335 RepID=A0A6A2YG71_HIBSY|nr:uncharacterized protein LOC120171372 [Hibiscus syriacus]KAE8672944.1 Tetratricopeptide repeat-like superfamily protein, putative isoform 1 [Hibiscus syriacus]